MLTDEEKGTISEELRRIKSNLRKELADGEWKKERRERRVLYEKLISHDNIDDLKPAGLKKVITSLWASRIWTNKNYLFNQILEKTEFSEIKYRLKELLYGEGDFAERFDNFINIVKGLGGSSVTEILVFMLPDKFSLWNDKPKNVLPLFSIKGLPERVFKYPLKSGKDYLACNTVMAEILGLMRKLGFPEADFLDLDIFMWMLFNERKGEIKVKKPKVEEPKDKREVRTSYSHEDVQALLLELGKLLGYSTYTPDRNRISKRSGKKLAEFALLKEVPPFAGERYLETVRYIDVVWFEGEHPIHCFEVEHSTDVSRGLLRLYQMRMFDVGLFIISPEEKSKKFQKEVHKDPFNEIKTRFKFNSFKQLREFFKKAEDFRSAQKEFFE